MQIDLVEDTHFNRFAFALISVELGLIEAMIDNRDNPYSSKDGWIVLFCNVILYAL
jgi:hypothetical protein